MKAIDFLHATFKHDDKYLVRPMAVMADGFFISIQGGTFLHMCSPRPCYMGDPVDEYARLECAYPSDHAPEIAEYANYGGDIYPNVPIEAIERLVENHGGIVYHAE